MGAATQEQVNWMLRLYELRRDPKLRAGRDRMLSDFFPQSLEDAKQELTLGTEKNAEFRMVASYSEMVAGISNRGLIDEDLYFETTLEPWILFEKLRPILPGWREMTKAPMIFSQLEEHSQRLEAWWERRGRRREPRAKVFRQTWRLTPWLVTEVTRVCFGGAACCAPAAGDEIAQFVRWSRRRWRVMGLGSRASSSMRASLPSVISRQR
jgi:hypothetical protein